jgi:hypothetical protein
VSRPRKDRPVLSAAEALAATRHLLVGPQRRRHPIPIVVPIEGQPTPRTTRPGLAGVTEAYLREWRVRLRSGARERRTKGGAA